MPALSSNHAFTGSPVNLTGPQVNAWKEEKEKRREAFNIVEQIFRTRAEVGVEVEFEVLIVGIPKSTLLVLALLLLLVLDLRPPA